MSISAEQLQEILKQQQKQFEEAQLRLIEALTQKMTVNSSPAESSPPTSSTDAVIGSISEFNFDADAGRTFEAWYKKYEDIFRTDFAKCDEAWKVRVLLRKLGTAEHERFTNFILPKRLHELGFEETIKILTEIFSEQLSLFNIRYQCLKLAKTDTEDFITYAGVVNKECERFKLSSMTEDQFKCLIFVAGLQSPQDADIRTRLLSRIEQDPDLTLQKLTTECQRLLNLKADAAMIEHKQGTQFETVHKVTDKKPTHTARAQPMSRKPPTTCWFCGEWHFSRHCQYRRHRCSKCNRRGHKEGFCRDTFKSSRNYRPGRRGHSKFRTATVRVNHIRKRKYLTVNINGKPARLQLDTGSDLTLISRRTWKLIGQPAVKPSKRIARGASGEKLNLIGELACSVNFKGTSFTGTCYLTDCPNLDLLGLDWIEELHLLDQPINSICNRTTAGTRSSTPAQVPQPLLDQLIQRYASVFTDGLGCCTKMKAHLSLLPDAGPVFRPKRPVPYAALPVVDQELERLQKAGVIQPVNYSAWAAPIVVVKKSNGSIRLCADFSTGLNAALATHQYPLPVPEDLFAKLNGGTCFAKIDLADAYLQIEVDEASKELLTINTHRGLFQYNRLPFGVKTAPAIFQQIMDTMLKDAPGVAAYLDDLIVMGSTTQELLERLDFVLSRIQDYGFRIRKEKCVFFMKSIRYLGFVIDEHGRRPDPDNIVAIQKMPPPHDVSTLRSFLGLVSHYSAFLPAMHQIRGPLNQLLAKDVKWNWSAECQHAFERIKALLASDLLLTHYDPNLEIIVASDASQYGVGAVISHKFPDGSEKAIAHAARSLTAAERNYGQIEKEALAIVFAIKKFHKMIYGRRFTLLTDHKPLLAVFGSKKGIPVYTANRLQRWATMLLGYDFKIKYQPTTTIGQADALSRLIDSQKPEPDDCVIATISIEPEINRVVSDLMASLPITAETVRQETQRDTLLQKVLHLHQTGWPEKCPTAELNPYFHRRDALSMVNGCLLFAERVIVPRSLQKLVLKQFHAGHPGVNRMKSLARSYVYWPGMDKELEEMSRACPHCVRALKNPTRTELHSWPHPTKPWSRIHIDYAGPMDGVYYLVVVDAYSKWPEILPMRNATASSTIVELRRVFSRFGSPEILVSDNGSQFTSAQFEEFCRKQGTVHIRSPPFHPQSNGQAERFVDTFKRALQKAKGEGPTEEILQQFLMNYRMTPNPQVPENASPAEAMFKRKLRMPHDAIRPAQNDERQRNRQMEQQYNQRYGAVRKNFQAGQKVLVRDYRERQPRWVVGRVIRRRGNVLYEVQVGSHLWVRHANQIRPTNCVPVQQDSEGLTLDTLLDIFELPQGPERQRVEPEKAQPSRSLEARRWTDRRRRPVRPLQVNPKLLSYEQQPQGGGVRGVRISNLHANRATRNELAVDQRSAYPDWLRA